ENTAEPRCGHEGEDEHRWIEKPRRDVLRAEDGDMRVEPRPGRVRMEGAEAEDHERDADDLENRLTAPLDEDEAGDKDRETCRRDVNAPLVPAVRAYARGARIEGLIARSEHRVQGAKLHRLGGLDEARRSAESVEDRHELGRGEAGTDETYGEEHEE